MTDLSRLIAEQWMTSDEWNFLHPTGCFCLCHDFDGDTNIDGGCEDCTDIHEEDRRPEWMRGISLEVKSDA